MIRPDGELSREAAGGRGALLHLDMGPYAVLHRGPGSALIPELHGDSAREGAVVGRLHLEHPEGTAIGRAQRDLLFEVAGSETATLEKLCSRGEILIQRKTSPARGTMSRFPSRRASTFPRTVPSGCVGSTVTSIFFFPSA